MKLRVQACFLILISSLFSCNRTEKSMGQVNKYLVATSDNYKIDSSIFITAAIFIDSLQNKNSIKELFIDKIYEDQTILTYRAKPVISNYFEINKPPFIFWLQPNIFFYVYIGMEDLITGDLLHINNIYNNDTASTNYLCMSFIVDKNKRFTLNSPCNIPFAGNLYLAPQPEIDVKKYKSKTIE